MAMLMAYKSYYLEILMSELLKRIDVMGLTETITRTVEIAIICLIVWGVIDYCIKKRKQ